MRRLLSYAATASLLLPGAASSQDRSVGDDLAHVLGDAGYVLSAPAHATSADLATAGLIAGGFGLLLFADEPVQQWLRDQPQSVLVRAWGPFRESSPISMLGLSGRFLVPLSAVIYGAGLAFDSQNLRDAGVGCAVTNVTTSLSRTLVSMVVGRLRPGSGRGSLVFEPFGGWDTRSFPGGHAANVMSCASFFSHRFDLGLAEPALYATAFAVGTARIVDEAHWTSDTFAGMAYGYSIGKAMAARYRVRAAERSMQPSVDLGWRISF